MEKPTHPRYRKLKTDAKNILLVKFDEGAGGKFLINCIGLSDGAVLQHSALAEAQLQGLLLPQDKFDLIMSRLQAHTGEWADLGLHSSRLFGIAENDYAQRVPSTMRPRKVIYDLCDNGKVIAPQVLHHIPVFEMALKMWSSAKIIIFNNDVDFIKQMRPRMLLRNNPSLSVYWNDIRGSDWPKHPPYTIDRYNQLPEYIRTELEDIFNGDIFYHITYPEIIEREQEEAKLVHDTARQSRDCFDWDTTWYFDEDSTISGVSKVYDWLGLTDFNEQMVREYYSLWIQKIKEEGY